MDEVAGAESGARDDDKTEQAAVLQGEWVRVKSAGAAGLACVLWCKRFGSCKTWIVHTGGTASCHAGKLRRASARELLAESRRLMDRANVLIRAADAVEKAKVKP